MPDETESDMEKRDQVFGLTPPDTLMNETRYQLSDKGDVSVEAARTLSGDDVGHNKLEKSYY